MIKSLNKHLVAIEPDEVAETTESGLHIPDTAKDNLQKAQNRGKVILVGAEVPWPEKGMYVSFYRNAATDITEDGKKYLTLHHMHVLAEISTK